MRQLITISFFLFSVTFTFGQTNILVSFPDSLKTSKLYFSPILPYSTIPHLFGQRKITQPYDSIKYIFHDYLNEGYDTTNIVQNNDDRLTLTIDTTQEINSSEYFSKSTKDYNLYSTPRKIKIVSDKGKAKTFFCNKDTDIVFKAYPVAISNLTKYAKSIYIKEFAVEILQEAKDKNGKWKPI